MKRVCILVWPDFVRSHRCRPRVDCIGHFWIIRHSAILDVSRGLNPLLRFYSLPSQCVQHSAAAATGPECVQWTERLVPAISGNLTGEGPFKALAARMPACVRLFCVCMCTSVCMHVHVIWSAPPIALATRMPACVRGCACTWM